ncbi:outer membrane beta-barrel protein [Vibrio cholerae]|nr:outer membrane beta-barrel protein [Vibrio cholerae]EGQ8188369.1 porin family protein [Vibrio cholerae]EGR0357414.1 porin family protein [Vibrio cholerae]EGR0518010.1 porin family protein [Vibrio cholerae]EGR0545342.1 porin family protein [Vibrio cholerae]EGR0568775.1 porin family protein [Vibrio cholerae]
MFYKYISVCMLAIISMAPNAHAKHVVGANLGYGGSNYDVTHNKEDGDAFMGELYYRYMVDTNWGIETGYKGGFNGFASMLTSPITEVTDTGFGGPRVSGYVSYPLGNGFELYGKGGLTYYTLNYTIRDRNTGHKQYYDDSTLGGELAGGVTWGSEYFGLNLEYNYATNDNFNVGGVVFGAYMKF